MTGMYGAVAGSPNGSTSALPAQATGVAKEGVGTLPPIPPRPKRDDEETGKLLLGSVQRQTAELRDDDYGGGGINEGIFGRGARRQDNGSLVTVFLLVNFMIGSGILNTPQTFRYSGLAATTVLYFVACPATWFGAVVLIQAAEASSTGGEKEGGGGGGTKIDDLEFTTLAKRTLGKYGPSVVDGSIVLESAGSVCSYVVLIGGLATSVIVECSGGATGVWWQSFYFVTPLIFLLFVLPPCLVRHFSNLRWLAVFSIFAIAGVVSLVAVGSRSYAEAERLSEPVEAGLDAPLLWWDWTGCLAKIGSLMFTVAFAAAALHNYSAMRTRTTKEWRAVAGASVLTASILCYCTGITGYLAFRSATEGDILDNFPGPAAACFKVLIVLHLIIFIPGDVIILRHSLFTLVGRDVMAVSFMTVSAVTAGVLAAIVGVVIALMFTGIAQGDLFGYLLDLTGGITASLTGFVIPALTYLQATKGMVDRHDVDGKNVAAYRTGCKFLVVFGCIVMVMVPTAVVLSAISK